MYTEDNGCGCSKTTIEYKKCNKCKPEVPCDCPVKDLSTDCGIYKGDDIKCGETTVVAKNRILSDALKDIVAYMCQRFSDLMEYLKLINVGTGAQIYAGDTLLGVKKIRTLTEADTLIDIVQSTDEISIGVNEEALEEFVEENQNNFVRYLIIPPTALPLEYTEQDICDYILALPEDQRTILPTDSKWNILIAFLPG